MGMTMTQKILAKAAGLSSVQPGQLIEARLNLVLGNDITTPVAITEFEKAGFTQVFDKDRIAIVLDHYTPCKDIKSAQLCKQAREFAHKHSITHFYDVGQVGVEHALIPEKGLAAPGEVIVGADSHTCTYGALGAFSTGVGSTDAGVGLATGRAWFKVPPTIRFEIDGELPAGASAKDIILHIIGLIGVDGALYQAMEFAGSTIESLSMEGRMTISNMAIEAGGKAGIIEVDDVARAWLDGRCQREYVEYHADADAEYARVIHIDAADIKPCVSWPHLPSNTHPVEESRHITIDQAVIGSCTNGRIEDMRAAAQIMRGRSVAPGVRCIVIPATQAVFKQCMAEGLADTFIDAGCVFSTPTCGPCLGGYMGILAAGERCVSTTNRNFVGRMGDTTSEVYLASPAVAAASAVAGHIALPADLPAIENN